MTPIKKKKYIIMDADTGHVIHEGADRRSILPNEADFRNQLVVGACTLLITSLLGIIGYCGDTAYKGVVASISDLKDSNEKSFQQIYTRMSISKANRDNQFNWVSQQCCQNAKVPPPVALPQ